jgi:basic membrane lipoprotein Med (substrate-binding protein (PBP1-ABC) superfamily)
MNENPDLHFTFTMQEANAVLAALQELPAKISNPLSQKMTEQAQAQIEKIKADMASDVTDVE